MEIHGREQRCVFKVKIDKNEDFMIQCLQIWRVYVYGKLAKEITV
jgi:hypothetical protein